MVSKKIDTRAEKAGRLAYSVFVAATIALVFAQPLFARSKEGALKGAAARGAAASRAAWCHAVVAQQLLRVPIAGIVCGRPFKPDVVQWNSYSITLKQSHKRYCKVVINLMKSQKPLCNLSFTSDTNNRPHIYVYSRSSNSQPVVEQHYTCKDSYGLKFALLTPLSDDSVPGSLSLRLPDGSFVAGCFKAEKAPRIIWDDESISP